MTTKQVNKPVGWGPRPMRDRGVEEYWTPERIAAAKPLPLPKVQAGEGRAEVVKPEGEPESLAPEYPKGHKKGATTAGEIEPRGRGGNPVAAPLEYPYTTCGRLFFTQDDVPSSASASVVGRNLLLTAGHCVFYGKWSKNVMFRPSFPDRIPTDPANQFLYSYEATWTAWTKHNNRAFDYGFIWINEIPGCVGVAGNDVECIDVGQDVGCGGVSGDAESAIQRN